jgi:type IV pilus assembly protein PilA
MNNTKNRLIQQLLLNKKASSKKQNGFTLIELMVVVAIVGILSAVGLPELTKAQNRAKDATAQATLTNAAKECSLSLILNGDNTDYTAANFEVDGTAVSGDCELTTDTDGVTSGPTLEVASATGTEYEIVFNGSTPGVAAEAE